MQANATTQQSAGRAFPLQPIDLAGLGCLLGYGILAWAAQQPGEPHLALFFVVMAWTALLTFGFYAYQGRRETALSVPRLILWAVAFRVCGLLGGPFFEDDYFRYLWDGYLFAQQGTPYGAAPEAYFIDPNVPAAFHRILDQLNYPEVPTIYGPVAQLSFLLGHWLQPGGIAVLQGMYILVDLLTILLLLRLAPARAVLLYAWCPLVVKEIAFTAHSDILGVGLLAAAVLLAQKERLKAAAVCLALSVGAKIFALLLVPFVLVRGRLAHWAIFAAVLALLYAPFALQHNAACGLGAFVLGDCLLGLPVALLASTDLGAQMMFVQEWQFNAAAFGLLSSLLSNFNARLVVALLMVGFGLCCYMLHRRDPTAVPRGDWLFGAMLFLAPVVNPWYLLWVLPFAVIRPSFCAWTASLAVLLSYVTGLHLNDMSLHPYDHPAWVLPLEFGLILAALGWDLFRHRRSVAAAGA